MTIAIYLQSGFPGLGGAEFWTSCLAAHFRRQGAVTVFHHKPDFNLDVVRRFTGIDLAGVGGGHSVTIQQLNDSPTAWPGRTCAASEASANFDLFVVITHSVPPECRAGRGAVIVMFPLLSKAAMWPWSHLQGSRALWASGRAWWYGRRFARRFDSYDVAASLSDFSKEWTAKWWGLQTDVVYPPNDVSYDTVAKESLILSVGRFTPQKAQRELATMFETRAHGWDGWSLACAGTLSNLPHEREYFGQAEAVCSSGRVSLLTNLSRSRLKATLERSSIFWHAVGWDADPTSEPGRCEHFGHVTVEAMAAGSVPVVIGKGGQREIIRDGVDGFLCDTLDEMGDRTQWLIDHPDALEQFRASARKRALDFSIDASMASLDRLLAASADRTSN